MAKFNEKALCLFHKDYKQLKKEADRRGIPFENMERTTARIIWKDAYDAGYNEGKNLTAQNDMVHYCPANYYKDAKSEVKEYCLYDTGGDIRYRLELTKEQFNAIEWMINHNFTVDVELSEWCDSFENIGRI